MNDFAVGEHDSQLRIEFIIPADQSSNKCEEMRLRVKTQMPDVGIVRTGLALLGGPGIGLTDRCVTGDGVKRRQTQQSHVHDLLVESVTFHYGLEQPLPFVCYWPIAGLG